MALPERRDPNHERRIEEFERRRMETERAATAGGFGWWWLWLLIIIAIVWFAGWGWGGYGGWWWGRAAVAPGGYATDNASDANGTANGNNAAVLPTGDGVAILSAANKAQFIGQQVDIRNVPVNHKIKDRALWIGNSNGNNAAQTANSAEVTTLVVLTGTAQANGGATSGSNGGNNTANGSLIREGQLVDVIGTVEKAPTANVAEKQWGIDHDGAQRLEREGAYIHATQVATPAGQQQ